MNKAARIEANLAAFLLAMGQAGGGEGFVSPRLSFTIGGSPIDYHNAVFAARLDPSEADAAIARSVALFRHHGVPGSWHLGPSSQPTDLGERLLAHGFSAGFPERGMSAAFGRLSLESVALAGLGISEVCDEAELAIWIATLAEGFGEGPREAEWVGSCWRRLGFGPGTPWRHFLGRLHGSPVATATLFIDQGVAGLYFVFTTEAARRRGIGAAVTGAALRVAAELGCSEVVLGASAGGAALYRRLGFDDVCALPIYEWHPLLD